MENEKIINNNVVKEHEIKEPKADIQPTITKYVDETTFNNLKANYEKLEYDFLALKNEIMNNNTKENETADVEPKNDLDDWLI